MTQQGIADGDGNAANADQPHDNKDKEDETAMALDELGCDETAAYRIRFSKWNQGAFHAIQCPLFWFLIGICRVVRSPLRHFMLFLQKQAAECPGECVFHLVTGKLDEFNEDFRNVFSNLHTLIETSLDISGCRQLSDLDIARVKMLVRKLLLQTWSAFRRRVAKPLAQ